jgi:hypothetical protein
LNTSGQPVGFWIADGNAHGTDKMDNPDGFIRKRFIPINPGAGRNDATQWRVVYVN